MEYEKLTNPEHYKSHAVTVEPILQRGCLQTAFRRQPMAGL